MEFRKTYGHKKHKYITKTVEKIRNAGYNIAWDGDDSFIDIVIKKSKYFFQLDRAIELEINYDNKEVDFKGANIPKEEYRAILKKMEKKCGIKIVEYIK